MFPVFRFEVKYYIKNSSEAIRNIGLFVSIVLLYPFSHVAGEHAYQGLAGSILWIALTVMAGLGGITLYSRDHESGRLEYYQLSKAGLAGVIFAKWLAYYLVITVPLAVVLPVVALLVDIPVGAWGHYGLGLASGAMALTILGSLISVVLTGLDKAGAVLGLVLLPLTIPVVIFGTHYLANTDDLLTADLAFLWGFSMLLLPLLCFGGASCIRAAN